MFVRKFRSQSASALRPFHNLTRKQARQRRLALEALERRNLLATFTVTSLGDSGPGTLRDALVQANANLGADVIAFNISGTGVKTISPLSALPTITDPVTIDGYSQPGAARNTSATAGNAVLQIELNGASAGNSNGLVVTAGNTTIRGLAINRFALAGIKLQAGGGNVIEGNHIGTDAAGTTARHNRVYGIEVVGGSSGNLIGTNGDGVNDLGERNVVSSNYTANVYISGAGTNNNVIAGNIIGLNVAGVQGSAFDSAIGVWIEGGSQGNRIGTDANGSGDVAERNIISRNTNSVSSGHPGNSTGIFLSGNNTIHNVVAGNFIGSDVTGTVRLSQSRGVKIHNTRDNRIGTNGDGIRDDVERNLISGNSNGVELEGATDILIAGNYIGTDVTGTAQLSNSSTGVNLLGASRITIGGTTSSRRNLISGNGHFGISISDSTAGSFDNVIQGNFIGTDITGTVSIDNGFSGAHAGINIGGQRTLVGGTAPGAGNLISGNRASGIRIEGPLENVLHGFNVVEGNLIGTDITGTKSLPNAYNGIFVDRSDNNRIGGTTAEARNLISANGLHGIYVHDTGNAADRGNTNDNVIQGNWIGVDSTGNGLMGNSHDGIHVVNALTTLIGGTVPGAGNLIADNDHYGIIVSSNADFTTIQGNRIGQTLNGSPAGNQLDGVRVNHAQGVLVGGEVPGAGNLITDNWRDFTWLSGNSRGPGGVAVTGHEVPTSWWRAESTAKNITDPAHSQGMLQNGASFAPGRFGFGFLFDGVNDYVSVPDQQILEPYTTMTWEAWIRPDDVTRAQQIVSKFGAAGHRAYQMGLAPNGVFRAEVTYDGTTIQSLQSPANVIAAGQWSHVAMTYEMFVREWKLYVNGNEVASRSNVLNIFEGGAAPVTFGAKSDATQFFGGLIDEVAMYRSIADIPALYKLGGVNKYHGTTIRGNSIFLNGDMGINLLPPTGPNTNDPDDTDVGANDLQNSPSITSATTMGSQFTVTGTLQSIAHTSYAIEIFASSRSEFPFAEIEGERFLGWGTAVTDGNGTANFSFTFAEAVPAGQFISATATILHDHDLNPNTPLKSFDTSEFSGPKTVVDIAGGTIRGQKFHDLDADGVMDPNEPGLGGWHIYLDTNGNDSHDPGEPRAITREDGHYEIRHLPAGSYPVRELPAAGWVQTTETVTVQVVAPETGPVYVVNVGNREVGATVSGVKFHDLNGDGIRDANEPGLASWTIYLDDNGNDQQDLGEASVETNLNGGWSFANLPAGTYRVREVQSNGWKQTTAPLDVTLTANGESFTDGLIGNYRLARISGLKFHDVDGDGIHDANEGGLGGWTIFLDDNDDGELSPGELSTVTAVTGDYQFDNLEAGTYRVREVQQAGWTQSTVNESVVVSPHESGQSYLVKIGNFRPGSGLQGIKFHDLNGNGQRDPDEPGLANWTIYLDANENDTLDDGEIWTDSTDDGRWQFGSLPAGTYRVREVAQPGWIQSSPPLEVTVGSDGEAPFGEIGNYRLATVQGVKFNDLDGDGERDLGEPGLAGWTIYLDANDNGELDANESSTTTGVAGSYSFPSVAAGTYHVREVLEAGWTQTSPIAQIEVLPNQSAQNYHVDIGNFRLGAIEGVKFHDLNGNGLRDAEEPGLPGWTIYLDANANQMLDGAERSTVSDAAGRWSFQNVAIGTYTVREVLQAGWVQTTPDIDVQVATSGEVWSDHEIGNYRLAAITGVKFNDFDGDGERDPGEPGLSGWTIFLDDNANGELDLGETSTTTGSLGEYSFSALAAGIYIVREVQQTGWLQTTADQQVEIVPNQSGQSYEVNIGNFELGTIAGIKYHDLNGNGLRDPGEPGLSGWTIYLDANGNEELDGTERSTVSDIDGQWSFRHLPVGTYAVREVQHAGWVQTSGPIDVQLTTSGQVSSGHEIGNYQLAVIHGVKFNDLDGDGDRDPGELGLADWIIYLDDNDNGALDAGEPRTSTSHDGSYRFDHLGAGTYRVREIQQVGWMQTTAEVTVEVLPNRSAQSYAVDVGNFQLGTVDGVKYHDLDGDGLRDLGEPGLPGWTIYLDANGNDTLDSGELSTVSDSNGRWSFGGLAAGRYSVREVPQAGWIQTSEPLDLTIETSGQTLLGAIGNFRLTPIHGVKFHDRNGNAQRDPGEPGIEGWQVFLDLDGDEILDPNERSTFTDADGVYTFADVGPGTWTVREVQDPGWLQTTPNPPAVTVSNLQESFEGGDFGNKLGSLSGAVYLDRDNDGNFDSDEDGIAGVLVRLVGTDDRGAAVDRSVLTGTHGEFHFADLRPGSYQILETQPAGYLDGKDTLGSLGHTALNDQFFTDLAKGQDGVNYHFGELEPAKLSGYVYDDTNDNGLIDLGEAMIPGTQITLTGTNDLNEVIHQIASTNAAGYYEFDGLRPGTYALSEQQPAGWLDGKDTLGSVGGTVGNDEFSAVSLAYGTDGVNYNFGEHADRGLKRGQTATIGYWQNPNGQALIQSLNGGPNATTLGNWLAGAFPNLYGANAGAKNLAGKTNAEIAAFYITLFKQKGPKLDAQVMAVAFAVYVTDSDLAGSNASPYGFIVDSAGTGSATVSVGTSGAAFGVPNHTRLTVLQILSATNARTSGGNLYNGSTTLRNQAMPVYDGINQGGDIY